MYESVVVCAYEVPAVCGRSRLKDISLTKDGPKALFQPLMVANSLEYINDTVIDPGR